VCECPLNTKLSLIGHNNHFVLLHVSIWSNCDCDCDYDNFMLFQILRWRSWGQHQHPACPCILHDKSRIFLCSE
jgi:hypothetical protein